MPKTPPPAPEPSTVFLHLLHAEASAEEVWNAFTDEYLLFIERMIRCRIRDHDDRMDAFAYVFEKLKHDNCRRLRQYDPANPAHASFATYLGTVVKNLIVDGVRRHPERRPRQPAPATLSPLAQRVYRLVVEEHWAHRAAFELLATTEYPDLTRRNFSRALQSAYRAPAIHFAPRLDRMASLDGEAPAEAPDEGSEEIVSAELRELLELLPAQQRCAVLHHKLEGLSADAVAVTHGFTNAKAVFNATTRGINELRGLMEERGLTWEDFVG